MGNNAIVVLKSRMLLRE